MANRKYRKTPSPLEQAMDNVLARRAEKKKVSKLSEYFDETDYESEDFCENEGNYWEHFVSENDEKVKIEKSQRDKDSVIEKMKMKHKIEMIKVETRLMFAEQKKKNADTVPVAVRNVLSVNQVKDGLAIPVIPTFIVNKEFNQEQFFIELSNFGVLTKEMCSRGGCKNLVGIFNEYDLIAALRSKLRYFSRNDFLGYFDVSKNGSKEKYNHFIWKTFKELMKIHDLMVDSIKVEEFTRSFDRNVLEVFEENIKFFAEDYIEILSTHYLEFIVNRAKFWHKSSKISNYLKMKLTEEQLFQGIAKEVSETSADILFMKSSLDFGNFRSPWNLSLRKLAKLFCMIDFSKIADPASIDKENIFGRAIMVNNFLDLNEIDDILRAYSSGKELLTEDEVAFFISNLQKCKAFTDVTIEDLVTDPSYAIDKILPVAWSYNDIKTVWHLFFTEVVKFNNAAIKASTYTKKERITSLLNSFWNSPAWRSAKSLRIPSKYEFDAYNKNVLIFMLEWLGDKKEVTNQEMNVLFNLCADNDYLLSNISMTFNENIVRLILKLPTKIQSSVYMKDSLEKIALKKPSWIDRLRGVELKFTETRSGMMRIPAKANEKVIVAEDVTKSIVSQNIKELTCGWRFIADGISKSNLSLIDEFSSAVVSAREFISLYPSLNDDTDFINSRIEVYWIDIVSTFHRERNRLENVRKFSTIKVEMNPNDTLEQNIVVLRAELQAMVDDMALRVANDSSFELQKMELYMNERFPRGVNSCKL